MRWFFYNLANPFASIFLIIFAGIGFALSLVISLSIELWSLIFGLSFLICIILFVVKKPNFLFEIDIQWTHRRRDHFVRYIPYLIFVPGFLIVFSHTYYQMLFEGVLHTSYTSQILAGVTPPENPFLPGYAPNYYWLYHALLATTANVTRLAPPLLSSILNLLAFISIFAWVKQIIRAMGYSHLHPFLFNMLAIFVVFGVNLFGIVHAMDDILVSGIGNLNDSDMILIGDRIQTLWFKFLAFTSFPLALAYYAMGIFAAIQIVKGFIRPGIIILLLFSLAGGIAFSLGTGLFSIIVLLPAIALAYGFELVCEPSQSFRSCAASLFQALEIKLSRLDFGLLTVLGLCIALLSLIYYRSATESYRVTGGFSLTDSSNLGMLISAFYPLIPFFIVGAVQAIKTSNRLQIFTTFGAILGCGAAYVSVVRGDNQYKFVLLSAFLICLTIVPVIHHMIEDTRLFRRLIAIMVLGLVMVNLGYADLIRIKNAMEFQQGIISTSQNINLIVYDGPYLVSEREIYQDIYVWLRDTTNARTIVVMPVEQSALLASISGRLPYVGRRLFSFVTGLPEYTERVDRLKAFFAAETSFDERDQLIAQFLQLDPARPMVLLIPHDTVIPFDQLTALDLQLLFQGEEGDIYTLRI
jgi:hypothetical protein